MNQPLTTYDTSSEVTEKHWIVNGIIHRDRGPAIVHVWKNGQVKKKIWVNNGQIRPNRDGLFRIEYYDNGQIENKSWIYTTKNGQRFHRYNSYYHNGIIIKKLWFKLPNNNSPIFSEISISHREDGPSCIEYDATSKIVYIGYYFNGVNVNQHVFELFKRLPLQLTKDQTTLLKLSLPNDILSGNF